MLGKYVSQSSETFQVETTGPFAKDLIGCRRDDVCPRPLQRISRNEA